MATGHCVELFNRHAPILLPGWALCLLSTSDVEDVLHQETLLAEWNLCCYTLVRT